MKHAFRCSLFLLPIMLSAVEPAQREEIKVLIRDKKWTEARAVLTPLLAAEPANAELHFNLGQSYLYAGEPGGAVTALEKATELDPKSSRYMRHLGDAYGLSAQKAGLFSKMGWAKKCKAAYDKSVELDPKDISARWSVMEFCRQAPSIIGGGMDQAYAQAAAIKQIDPNAGRSAYTTLYLSEKKYPEAFGVLDEILQEKPDDYDALYQFGKLADTTGQQLDRGLTALRKCLTLKPTDPRGYVPAHWRIGNILARQGDKTAARTAYEAALALDPKFKEATESLAKLNAS